jgi:soluble lytic murein transglycosylase-like protein
MSSIARTIAAATMLVAMVFVPAPEARRTEVGRPAPAPADLGYSEALERVRADIDHAQIDRILSAVACSAERFDVDPVMILAVIHVESRFDSRAVSSKGAMGLMQLVPGTARAVASQLEIDWSDEEQLFDPELNILLGTRYLRSMLDRFEDPDTALAAYNAGPTRVSRLQRTSGVVPRNYPERVSRAVAYFTSL